MVRLDAMLKYVPQHIQKKAFAEYGETLKGAAEAIWLYNKEIVDAVYDLVPAVKPQIAMYEQFGIEGLIAFQKTVAYCKDKGLVVIGDIKRGDIGSTSEAYAVGHLGKVQVGGNAYYGFDEDFVTVNPYLGSDGVNPFIKVCKEEKKGLFSRLFGKEKEESFATPRSQYKNVDLDATVLGFSKGKRVAECSFKSLCSFAVSAGDDRTIQRTFHLSVFCP